MAKNKKLEFDQSLHIIVEIELEKFGIDKFINGYCSEELNAFTFDPDKLTITRNGSYYKPISLADVAASTNNVDAMKWMFEKSKSIDVFSIRAETARGYTPVQQAASYGSYEILEYLSSIGVDINYRPGPTTIDKYPQSPIEVAMSYGQHSVAEYILNRDIPSNPLRNNKDALNLLEYAVISKDSVWLIEHIKKNNPDLWGKNKPSNRLLATAIFGNEINTIDCLIAIINPSFLNTNKLKNEHCPVHVAAQRGWVEVLEKLAANGWDIDSTSKSKETPIYLAAKNGRLEAFDFLMRNGADYQYAREIAISDKNTGVLAYIDQYELEMSLKSIRSPS